MFAFSYFIIENVFLIFLFLHLQNRLKFFSSFLNCLWLLGNTSSKWLSRCVFVDDHRTFPRFLIKSTFVFFVGNNIARVYVFYYGIGNASLRRLSFWGLIAVPQLFIYTPSFALLHFLFIPLILVLINVLRMLFGSRVNSSWGRISIIWFHWV